MLKTPKPEVAETVCSPSATGNQPNKKQRLTELDALRGIAAFSVLLFHYKSKPGQDLSFLSIGVTGVDLFFLISGYVIFMTLEKVSSAKDFIVSRLSRIYPSYLTMMMVTIVFSILFADGVIPTAKNIIGNISMLQPFFNAYYIDDVYWTLTVEIQFYAFMLVVFLSRKMQQIEWIGLVFVLLVLVFHIIAGTYFPDSKMYILPRSIFPFMCHFQLFLGGIMFYKMRTEGITWFRRISIIFCFLSSIYFFSSSGKSHFFISVKEYAVILLIYFAVFHLCIFKKLRFINMKPLIFLGTISYCLYLVHCKAGEYLYNYITARYSVNLPLLTVLIILLMIGLAAIVTYGIERPAIRFIRKRLMAVSVLTVKRKPILEKSERETTLYSDN